MAQRKLLSKYWFDIVVCVAVLLLVAIGYISFLKKPMVTNKKLRVTVEISDIKQVNVIKSIAVAEKTVYLNSVDAPVSVSNTVIADGYLKITLEGPGEVDPRGFVIFNGQRILIGQKAEIHASYFAKGKIIKVENAK